MDRAARLHCREAAAGRRRRRIARGKRRHRPLTGDQGAARRQVAGQNMTNFKAMGGIQESNLRIFRIRKPRIVLISQATRIPYGVVENLVGGGRL